MAVVQAGHAEALAEGLEVMEGAVGVLDAEQDCGRTGDDSQMVRR